MKQYRVTSANFVLPGETGDADAIMDSKDLAELKKLAGINALGLLEDYAQGGGAQDFADIPNDSNQQIMSPIGSNISKTANEIKRLEKANDIKPGTAEWFRLWFSKPYLTGEKPIGDAPAPSIARDLNRFKD